MKGLIIKDIMCLKKQLTVFIYVIIGVVVISVMYVLSAKFGNLALAGNEMLCPACGKKTPKGKFCMECGQPLSHSCPNCGNELPENAKFCLDCGQKL